jgi:Icc-related predicted phosphoesterase
MFEEGLEETIREMNSIGKPVLLIHGNHESSELTKLISKSCENITFLHKTKKVINDVLFFGFGGEGFSYRTPEFEKLSKKFITWIAKANKAVMIIHQPPLDTKLDKLGMEHVGNKSFKEFIKANNLKLVVCGHLHETFSKTDKVGKTKIINPGPYGMIVNI